MDNKESIITVRREREVPWISYARGGRRCDPRPARMPLPPKQNKRTSTITGGPGRGRAGPEQETRPGGHLASPTSQHLILIFKLI